VSNSEFRYQLPDHHDEQLRKFTLYSATGFGLLFILVLILILYADRWLSLVPFEYEEQFARPYIEFYDELRNKGEQKLSDEARLQALVDDLSRHMEMPKEIKIRLFLLDNEDANAFATLGGIVIVNRGLLDLLETENALAMVLAHEIAHIKHRDPMVGLSRGLLIQLIYSFISGSTGELASSGVEVGMLFFSREQEANADRQALKTLYKKYGHVGGATDFFSRVYAAEAKTEGNEGYQLPEWLSTHPDIGNRIDEIRKIAAENNWSFEKQFAMSWQTSETKELPKHQDNKSTSN
jgi:predicted Zn-dependent protease